MHICTVCQYVLNIDISNLNIDVSNMSEPVYRNLSNESVDMPKGKTKSRFDSKKNNGNWCNLPKYWRCLHCLRTIDGSKACEIMTCED